VLKTRIIPTLLYKDFGLVKGVQFDSWRRVGTVMQSVKIYNMREVDELVFLDITATPQGRRPDFALIDDIADECFMPLTVGGGISDIEDVRQLLRVGADKIAVCSAAIRTPRLVNEIADQFGSQCVVVSIDARRNPDGTYQSYINCGQTPVDQSPVAIAVDAASRGAGEILITSMDRDGTMTGYDLELLRSISSAVSIPVIAGGGAGSYEHMLQAILTAGASAIAASSMFHFTEQTPLAAKRYLGEAGIPVRR